MRSKRFYPCNWPIESIVFYLAICFFCPFPFVIFYLIIRRLQRPSKIALLLRKFDKSSQEALFLRDVVTQACWRVTVPVTLQDRGILGDLSKVLPPLSCALLLVLGLYGIVTALLTAASPSLAEPLFHLTFLLLFLLFVRNGASATFRFLKWAGAYQLTASHKALRRAREVLHLIQKPPLLVPGMTVLRSSAQSWRKLVRFLLRRADCILIDLTATTDNLLWEIAAASTILGPHKTIILYQRTEAIDARPGIESMLALHFGPELSAQFNWFGYPAPVDAQMSFQAQILTRSQTLTRSKIKEEATKLRLLVKRCIQYPAQPVPGGARLRMKIAEQNESVEGTPEPPSGEAEVVCGRCGFHIHAQPAITFWGFQRLQCPNCSQRLRIPLTPRFYLFYSGLLGFLISFSLDNLNKPLFLRIYGLAILLLLSILIWDAIMRRLSTRRAVELTKRRTPER